MSSNELILENLLERRDLNLTMLKHLDFELMMDPTEKEILDIKILQTDTVNQLKKIEQEIAFLTSKKSQNKRVYQTPFIENTMQDELGKNLIHVKQIFAKSYEGNSHIQEVIPTEISKKFQIDLKDLKHLHDFALKNPIYHNHYEQEIDGILCTVYEGDINDYWLNSIKHGSSCQPFYPTWIMSAFIMTLLAKKLGYSELVDIGSGDGRIAYCGNIVGLNSHSIEIDDVLVELQNIICTSTKQNFNPICYDALEFDYSSLNLKNPIFFIGGLAQMGGDVLATSIIDKINSIENLKKDTGIVFAGTNTKRQLSENLENGGWSSLIEKHDLKVIDTVSLPTIWTFDQDVETPYIYTEFK